MILIVASNKDIASLNIKEQILNKYPFSKTKKTFEQNAIEYDIWKQTNADKLQAIVAWANQPVVNGETNADIL